MTSTKPTPKERIIYKAYQSGGHEEFDHLLFAKQIYCITYKDSLDIDDEFFYDLVIVYIPKRLSIYQ